MKAPEISILSPNSIRILVRKLRFCLAIERIPYSPYGFDKLLRVLTQLLAEGADVDHHGIAAVIIRLAPYLLKDILCTEYLVRVAGQQM
ncbi:hypothetical protein D3C85_1675130 [compost metagenome]